MRLSRSLLVVSAGLSTLASILLAPGARAGTPGGGITIQLDDPTPLLAYDMQGLFAHGATLTAPPVVAVRHRLAARDPNGGDLECLSAAIYFEARSEPADGQRAVAQVVLNRVGRRGFPTSVCGVVYQGLAGGRGCQFKFVCDGSMAARRERGAWMAARRIAQTVIDGDILASLRGVTFFHTRAVKPDWSSRMVQVAIIGSHIFYRSGRA